MPLPAPLPPAHANRLLSIMYVADFLTQFYRLLGVRSYLHTTPSCSLPTGDPRNSQLDVGYAF